MPAFKPEEVEEILVAAINTGDVNAAMPMFESGATLVFPGGETVVGGVAIRESFTRRLAAKPKVTSKLVNILHGDRVVIAHYQWNVTATGPDGSSSTFSGVSDHLLRQQQDRTWRVAILSRTGAE